MIDRIFPAHLRDRSVETAVGAAAFAFGVIAMVWGLAALIVGSVVIGRWIGGLG